MAEASINVSVGKDQTQDWFIRRVTGVQLHLLCLCALNPEFSHFSFLLSDACLGIQVVVAETGCFQEDFYFADGHHSVF